MTARRPAAAERFLRGVAERLGVDPRHVFAAYEDVFYYLWRERRLPINVDPLDSKLEDPQERARLARVFGQGLERVAGHVLPLVRDERSQRWQSGAWFLRSEALLSGSGGFAAGVPPAARFTTLGCEQRTIPTSLRPIRCRACRRCRRTHRCACSRAMPRRSVGRGARPARTRVRALDHAHRAVRRAARRRAVCLHAADACARGLSGSGGGDRGHGRDAAINRCCSRATSRRRIRD